MHYQPKKNKYALLFFDLIPNQPKKRDMGEIQPPPPGYECVEIPDVVNVFREKFDSQKQLIMQDFQTKRMQVAHVYQKETEKLAVEEAKALKDLQATYIQWISTGPSINTDPIALQQRTITTEVVGWYPLWRVSDIQSTAVRKNTVTLRQPH